MRTFGSSAFGDILVIPSILESMYLRAIFVPPVRDTQDNVLVGYLDIVPLPNNRWGFALSR